MLISGRVARDRVLLACPCTQIDEFAAFAAEWAEGIGGIPVDGALAGGTQSHDRELLVVSCLHVSRSSTCCQQEWHVLFRLNRTRVDVLPVKKANCATVMAPADFRIQIVASRKRNPQ